MKKIAIICFTISALTSCNGADDLCGCTEKEIEDYAKSEKITIDKAKADCCSFEKIADEIDSEK